MIVISGNKNKSLDESLKSKISEYEEDYDKSIYDFYLSLLSLDPDDQTAKLIAEMIKVEKVIKYETAEEILKQYSSDVRKKIIDETFKSGIQDKFGKELNVSFVSVAELLKNTYGLWNEEFPKEEYRVEYDGDFGESNIELQVAGILRREDIDNQWTEKVLIPLLGMLDPKISIKNKSVSVMPTIASGIAVIHNSGKVERAKKDLEYLGIDVDYTFMRDRRKTDIEGTSTSEQLSYLLASSTLKKTHILQEKNDLTNDELLDINAKLLETYLSKDINHHIQIYEELLSEFPYENPVILLETYIDVETDIKKLIKERKTVNFINEGSYNSNFGIQGMIKINEISEIDAAKEIMWNQLQHNDYSPSLELDKKDYIYNKRNNRPQSKIINDLQSIDMLMIEKNMTKMQLTQYKEVPTYDSGSVKNINADKDVEKVTAQLESVPVVTSSAAMIVRPIEPSKEENTSSISMQEVNQLLKGLKSAQLTQ